jgi:hypothetical protein
MTEGGAWTRSAQDDGRRGACRRAPLRRHQRGGHCVAARAAPGTREILPLGRARSKPLRSPKGSFDFARGRAPLRMTEGGGVQTRCAQDDGGGGVRTRSAQTTPERRPLRGRQSSARHARDPSPRQGSEQASALAQRVLRLRAWTRCAQDDGGGARADALRSG